MFETVFKIVFGLFIAALVWGQIDRERKYKARQKARNKPRPQKIKVNYDDYDKAHNGYCVYGIKSGELIYYGVSNNFAARKETHLLNLQNKSHDNYILQREYDGGLIGEDSFYIHQDNLSRSQAYQMEFELRPRKNMGLNLVRGGE